MELTTFLKGVCPMGILYTSRSSDYIQEINYDFFFQSSLDSFSNSLIMFLDKRILFEGASLNISTIS